DVMDGHFVPNLTVGPLVVDALRTLCDQTGAWVEVHLMIESPERYLADFARAGADVITVPVEACVHLHRILQMIRDLGVRVGVSLNPATPLVALEEVLPLVDLATVMSVDPGFAGQRYIPGSTDRIRRLRRMLDAAGSAAWLGIDGGIHAGNAAAIVAAGATVVVAGTAIFGGPRSIRENVQRLRDTVQRAAACEDELAVL
ncbi:MAG: ribulose-phosphate 3-epimerase, partial [Candidatus Binatia bacterium]